jgi:apolipoprotein N-acyltransferase
VACGQDLLLSRARRWLVAFAGFDWCFRLAALRHSLQRPFLSFTLLVWLIDGAAGNPDQRRARRGFPAFRIGWCFGFGYFVGGLWWLGNALMSKPMSLPGRCRWR